MPFTVSHPAIVLPLAFLPKRWFSLTGLILGSMLPDFEYFLRMKVQSNYSHTLPGIFWFNLPLGIMLAFIFHNFVRNSLFLNLPLFLKSRLLTFTTFNWNSYFRLNWRVVITSFLIGTASHILWDSFTHNHGFSVNLFPVLQQTLLISNFQVPVYKLLQHSSSFIGGVIIVFSILRIPQDKNIQSAPNLTYWTFFSTIGIGVISIRLLTGLDYRFYGHTISTIISAILIALIVTPLIKKN